MVGDAPGGPYHKQPKPVSKQNQNHQNHHKPSNLMEIKGNGRGCHRGTLTTKTSKNHQNNQKHYQI